MMDEDNAAEYILAVDVGTTTLRGHIYDKNGVNRGTSSKKIDILHPKTGWAEMDPEVLFLQVKQVMQESIRAANITVQQVKCMGLATQRSTFMTWDRETGRPFHNLITWQDLRASHYVTAWNKSYTLKALNSGSKFLHIFTRKNRYLAASVLKFMTKQVTMRLLWALDNIPELRKRAFEDQVMFGCIDTWLLYCLTGKKVHATDYSNASCTGLYDPFQVEWSKIVCNMVNIPMSMLPEVKDTSGMFGQVHPDILGQSIPITASVADQQGAMFGQCCFEVGDIKCTMGTGTFIDLNTGNKPHASVAGLYPIIGWKIKGELTYLAEGLAADTGITLEWAKSLGFFEDVTETANIANSVEDSAGVCFVPAFSGLQAPINDDRAATSIIGLTPNATKAHIVRAMLESLAFRFKVLYETVLVETKIPLSYVRADDGGVCSNDFIMQLMSSLVNTSIDRSKQPDMTSLGAAFLAGLAAGVWESKEQLCHLRKSGRVFEPQSVWSQYKDIYRQWERAVTRSLQWYREADS
ncbi:putative glycerol kinase 5 [Haliotis rubra]|uniref:putative glycerol kinase 5 n=1 Tax=Haliotis rubra TaxID=36100 RepID=UPI001EE51D64|nr:putative glycerol kinase 5 [Haliotis rubra]